MNLFMLILLPTLSLGNKIAEVNEHTNEQNVPESPRLMGIQQNERMQKYLDRIRRHQPTTSNINDGTSAMPNSTKITLMNYNYLQSYHLNHEKYQNLEEKKSLIKKTIKSKRLRRSKRSPTNSDNVDNLNEDHGGHNIVKFELIDAKIPDSDTEKMLELSKVQMPRNARSKKDISMDELSTVVVAPPPPPHSQSIASSNKNAQYKSIGELPIGVQNTINNMLFQQEQRKNYSINDKNPMEIGKRLYINNNNNGHDINQHYGYLNNLQKNYYLNNKMKQNILSNKLNTQLDQIRSKRLHASQTKQYYNQPLQFQLQHHQSHPQQQQQQQQPPPQQHQQPSPAQYPQFIKTYRFTTLDQPFIPSIPMPETKETKLEKSASPQIAYIQHLPPVNINYVFKDTQQSASRPILSTEQSHQIHPIQYAFPYIDLVKYTNPIRYGGDQLLLHQQQQQQPQHLQLNQQEPQTIHPAHIADHSVADTIHSNGGGGGGGVIYGQEIDVGALSSLLGKSPAIQLNGFNKLLQQSSELIDHQNVYQRPQDSTSPVKFPIGELSGGKAQPQTFLDISANLSPIPNKDHTPIIEHSDENTEKPITIVVSPASTIRHSSSPSQQQSHHHQPQQHQQSITNYPGGVPPQFYLNGQQENGIKNNLFSHHQSNDNHNNNNNNDNGDHRDHNDADDGIVESKDLQYASGYAFGYRVRDFHTGNDFGHIQNRDTDGITRGEYHILLPDGRVQNVRYTADEKGFHADVSYESVH